MNLNVTFNETRYKSNSIENGRIAKSFFKRFSSNVFNQAYKYVTKIKELTGDDELPLLFGERNLYSTIAVAIDKITPLHLSEWSFNKNGESTELNKQRIVDFWCLNKDGATGRPINYFLEIKTGYYCLTSRSQDEVTTSVRKRIDDLISQLSDLKVIKPDWNEFDNIYIGAIVIYNYHNGQDFYDEDDLMASVEQSLDGRKGIQSITANWTLPKDLKIQWEKDQVKSISIVGFILSNKK